MLSWKKSLLIIWSIVMYFWAYQQAIAVQEIGRIDRVSSFYEETLAGRAIDPKKLESELKTYISIDEESENLIGYIAIDDKGSGINQATWLYVKKAIDYYLEIKPRFIVLELNTPGGEVLAAENIANALKELDIQHKIPVVAYINNWAISAGALLAYSCRFIAAAEDASMGAAEPLTQSAEGKMEVASEKVNSALRADFANRARFFGRNPYLAEAMVDKEILLVRRHGEIIKLDSEAELKVQAEGADKVISPKGKLLTLDAEQLLQYGVADFVVPSVALAKITEEERESGVWPASKLSLFQEPFFKKIPNATIVAFTMDWKMRFFAWLASPMISSLLFLGVMMGFYLEFSMPGLGWAGSIAITCLFLIMLSSFSLEIANWLELILLLVGALVIMVELFILPTFGLLGFFGIIFFLMGLFGMLLPGLHDLHYDFDTKTFNAAGQLVLERLAWLLGTLVVAFGLMVFLGRYYLPSMGSFSRLVLKGDEQTGYSAVDPSEGWPKPGSFGEAITPLKPAGRVSIDNRLYDAMSEGIWIEKGSTVIVKGAEGSCLVVELKENLHAQ